MDARRDLPLPPAFHERVRALSNDLRRARLDLAQGRLDPGSYARLSHDLDARLRDLEAEVQARLLHDARVGRVPVWTPKKGQGS